MPKLNPSSNYIHKPKPGNLTTLPTTITDPYQSKSEITYFRATRKSTEVNDLRWTNANIIETNASEIPDYQQVHQNIIVKTNRFNYFNDCATA